jgi:hypothetical protein
LGRRVEPGHDANQTVGRPRAHPSMQPPSSGRETPPPAPPEVVWDRSRENDRRLCLRSFEC